MIDGVSQDKFRKESSAIHHLPCNFFFNHAKSKEDFSVEEREPTVGGLVLTCTGATARRPLLFVRLVAGGAKVGAIRSKPITE